MKYEECYSAERKERRKDVTGLRKEGIKSLSEVVVFKVGHAYCRAHTKDFPKGAH